MSLAPGVRLGPYEIVSAIGAGGMGDVYRARDARLGRSVAVKVLHAHAAEDATGRLRFEREARAVSSLNHPHICSLYDVGKHDGHDFLVMELLEGQTLADRLKKGPIPLDRALRYTIEIAEALDQAHRRGITHRDLKPANVMLTPTGAKLLDFGVAKLRDRGAEATHVLDRAVARLEPPSSTPTDQGITQDGDVLGTFEYMAPEQLEGHEADERSDIFAFGALIYEMVTGRKAFEASTRAALIGAVLISEPAPMRASIPNVPPLLELVVGRCLAKDSDDRWQSVRDILVALTWIADGVAAPSQPIARKYLTGRAQAALAAAALLVAVTVGVAVWSFVAASPASDGVLERWDLAIPSGQSLAPELSPSLAVSPDGSRVVFRAQSGAVTNLYMRRINAFEAEVIPGTEGAHTPFFSPDGQWIGFLANSKVQKIPIVGGAPQTICEAPSLSPGSPGATWSLDGTIVFAAGVSGLMYVPASGGTAAPLTTPNASRGEVSHISPQFLPGGHDLLFAVRTADDGWRLAVLGMGTRQWEWLAPIGNVAGARYVKSGHIVYSQAGGLHAIAFDLSRRAFGGPAFPVSESVYTQTVSDAVMSQFAVSDSGVLAYISGSPPDWKLVSVDLKGEAKPIIETSHAYRYPRFSPDGRHVTLTVEEERADVYVVDVERGTLRNLTKTGSNITPVWTSNGQRVAFASRRLGSNGYDVYWAPMDESAEAEPLIVREGEQFPSAWSPLGSLFAFYELGNKTSRDIWIWSLREKTATALVSTQANERGAVFSPDGRWLAYVSNEVGQRDEVYVQRYPGPGGREVVSSGGGTEPVWSPNGRELFYRKRNQLLAVTIRTEPTFSAEIPRVLFEGPYVQGPAEPGRPNYDVAPDGQSFVMVHSVSSSATHLHIVQNWFDQLRAPRSF